MPMRFDLFLFRHFKSSVQSHYAQLNAISLQAKLLVRSSLVTFSCIWCLNVLVLNTDSVPQGTLNCHLNGLTTSEKQVQ